MLHGGGAALQHLDRRIEGVEAVADPPHAAKMRQPEFQRREGHAHHQGRQAEMMVAVDEARHRDAIAIRPVYCRAFTGQLLRIVYRGSDGCRIGFWRAGFD